MKELYRSIYVTKEERKTLFTDNSALPNFTRNLKVWRNFINKGVIWNVRMDPVGIITICTDACEKGIGGYSNMGYFMRKVPMSYEDEMIAVKELLAVSEMIRKLNPFKKLIFVITDNMNVCWLLIRGKTLSQPLSDLYDKLRFYLTKRKCSIAAGWVGTESNTIADSLSRDKKDVALKVAKLIGQPMSRCLCMFVFCVP